MLRRNYGDVSYKKMIYHNGECFDMPYHDLLIIDEFSQACGFPREFIEFLLTFGVIFKSDTKQGGREPKIYRSTLTFFTEEKECFDNLFSHYEDAIKDPKKRIKLMKLLKIGDMTTIQFQFMNLGKGQDYHMNLLSG